MVPGSIYAMVTLFPWDLEMHDRRWLGESGQPGPGEITSPLPVVINIFITIQKKPPLSNRGQVTVPEYFFAIRATILAHPAKSFLVLKKFNLRLEPRGRPGIIAGNGNEESLQKFYQERLGSPLPSPIRGFFPEILPLQRGRI
jgi:hypothetical protein